MEMQGKNTECRSSLPNIAPYLASQEPPHHEALGDGSPSSSITQWSEGDVDRDPSTFLDHQGEKSHQDSYTSVLCMPEA